MCCIIMADIISVSSGSDDDSDIMLISSYQEAKEDAVPFIREEWLPVTPILIDITDQKLVPSRQRGSKRDTISPIIIDLRDVGPSDDVDVQSQNSSFETQTNDAGKDVTSSECFVDGSVHIIQKTETLLHRNTHCNSALPSELSENNKPIEHCSFNDISSEALKPLEGFSEVLKNSIADASQDTKDTQLSSPDGFSIRTDHETEEKIDSLQIEDGGFHSPYSLDSPYYCPSEIDGVLFSDESNTNKPITAWKSQQLPQISDSHTELVSNTTEEDSDTVNTGKNKDIHKMSDSQFQLSSPSPPSLLGLSPPCTPELAPRQNSPTSTEILASDTPAYSPGLSLPSSFPSTPSLSDRAELRTDLDIESMESSPTRFWQEPDDGDHEDVPNNVDSDFPEDNRQHICLVQFRKLRQCMVGRVPMHGDGEEDEVFGSPEPLCRQSLSLVNSTIEENYPEGTLQLLSDFIQPRYYPPVDITKHLLRGIFLEPQSPDVLAIEAYNLLMKIQRYHPADTSTVPWDWELLASVMEEQDDTRRLRTEVRCLLLQYVLQVLKDDFQFKLRNLQKSVAKAMLSCEQRFRHVKDIINWMMNAAKESVNCSAQSNNSLKIVLSLQRMLTLALEVDKAPLRNSSKLLQELFQSFNTISLCRQRRLLLLSTLENKLLRCELLNLLLDDACSQKKGLPMSLSLLLHYMQSSTLASDPSDGEERWRKWDELLQLLWMLMLSYEEVVTGHLRCSITERFDRTRSPSWTRNDQVTRSMVRQAAKVFLTRAVEDIGHGLPMEMLKSLSQLQDLITDTSSVIQVN